MRAFRPQGEAASSGRGFTVAELAIAMAILFTVIVAVMSALAFASASAQSSAHRETALNLANQRIEQARNLDYDDIGVVGGDPPGVITHVQSAGDYTIHTTVYWARNTSTGRAMYKRVLVEVTWTKPHDNSIKAETAIYGKSNLVNTGDVNVTCVLKGTSTPIPGATVIVTAATGADRSGDTDSEGTAFFGFVPAGAASISVSKEGYVWDLQQVQQVTILPEILSPYTIEGYEGGTVNVHVVDSSGNPIPDATAKVTQTLQTDTTGADGMASIGALKIGAYTLTVTAAGRSAASQSFEIASAGETVDLTVTMTDPSALTVKVLGTGAQACQNATVTVTAPGGGAAPGSPKLSSASGEAAFDITTSGTYTIVVSATGYQTKTTTVAFVSGTPAAVTVQLDVVAATTGGLDITLRYTNGTIAAGRRVHVWCSNPVYDRYFITDSNGQVAVRDLMPGLYWVQPVSLTSYIVRGNAVSAQVGSGQIVAVNVIRQL